jgi:hypothetical protein
MNLPFEICFMSVSVLFQATTISALSTYTNMVMNKMQRTKIAIALVAVAALTLVAVGLASAQLQANQTYNGTTTPNGGGFLVWIGQCLGFGPRYYGTQAAYQTPLQANTTVTDHNTNQTTTHQGYGYGIPFYQGQPQNITAPEPYTGATTYPSYYGYGYGYGGCMSRFYP